MNDFGFSLGGTVAGLIAGGVLAIFYLRLYRQIPSLESFTALQKRVLVYQLLAMSFWTIVVLGISLYTLWSGFRLETLFERPINIVIAISNWVFFGFIGITSLFPGVSIIGATRSWNLREPSKGQESYLYGVVILALLLYWTWKVFLPSL